jgi:hypothetical protein
MAKSGAGIGVFLWKISVALYLIANGALGLSKGGGDFRIILREVFSGSMLNTCVTIAAIIALVAGIAVILEMLNVKLSFLDTLILIIAIIWVVYVVLEIISWLKSGFSWEVIQKLAVHLMVLASLLIASRKFG